MGRWTGGEGGRPASTMLRGEPTEQLGVALIKVSRLAQGAGETWVEEQTAMIGGLTGDGYLENLENREHLDMGTREPREPT